MAVAFGEVLRRFGVDVPTGAVVTFVEALGQVGVDDRLGVYWAGRSTLLTRHEDQVPYDRAFAAFWLGREGQLVERPEALPMVLAVDDDDIEGQEGDADDDEGEERDALIVRYSPVELLRHKDFAAYSHGEFDEARRLMADLRLTGALRRSRRLRPTHRGKGRRFPFGLPNADNANYLWIELFYSA